MEPFEHNGLLSSTSNQPSWCVLAGACPCRAEDSSLWMMSRSGSNGRSHDIWAKWWRDWILLVMWPLKTMESVIRLWLISSIYVAYISIDFLRKFHQFMAFLQLKLQMVEPWPPKACLYDWYTLIAFMPFRIAQFNWIESKNDQVSHLSTSPIEHVTAKIPSYSSWECYISSQEQAALLVGTRFSEAFPKQTPRNATSHHVVPAGRKQSKQCMTKPRLHGHWLSWMVMFLFVPILF